MVRMSSTKVGTKRAAAENPCAPLKSSDTYAACPGDSGKITNALSLSNVNLYKILLLDFGRTIATWIAAFWVRDDNMRMSYRTL